MYYCRAANNGWWPVMTSDLFSQPFVFMFTCKYILVCESKLLILTFKISVWQICICMLSKQILNNFTDSESFSVLFMLLLHEQWKHCGFLGLRTNPPEHSLIPFGLYVFYMAQPSNCDLQLLEKWKSLISSTVLGMEKRKSIMLEHRKDSHVKKNSWCYFSRCSRRGWFPCTKNPTIHRAYLCHQRDWWKGFRSG